jgi:hypothetical protein
MNGFSGGACRATRSDPVHPVPAEQLRVRQPRRRRAQVEIVTRSPNTNWGGQRQRGRFGGDAFNARQPQAARLTPVAGAQRASSGSAGRLSRQDIVQLPGERQQSGSTRTHHRGERGGRGPTTRELDQRSVRVSSSASSTRSRRNQGPALQRAAQAPPRGLNQGCRAASTCRSARQRRTSDFDPGACPAPERAFARSI